MPKTGISVTLDEKNLLWLKARTLAKRARSVSETLDELVSAARNTRGGPVVDARSVVGTIDLPADDPALESADSFIRDLFDKSTGSAKRTVRGQKKKRAAARKRRG